MQLRNVEIHKVNTLLKCVWVEELFRKGHLVVPRVSNHGLVLGLFLRNTVGVLESFTLQRSSFLMRRASQSSLEEITETGYVSLESFNYARDQS